MFRLSLPQCPLVALLWLQLSADSSVVIQQCGVSRQLQREKKGRLCVCVCVGLCGWGFNYSSPFGFFKTLSQKCSTCYFARAECCPLCYFSHLSFSYFIFLPTATAKPNITWKSSDLQQTGSKEEGWHCTRDVCANQAAAFRLHPTETLLRIWLCRYCGAFFCYMKYLYK